MKKNYKSKSKAAIVSSVSTASLAQTAIEQSVDGQLSQPVLSPSARNPRPPKWLNWDQLNRLLEVSDPAERSLWLLMAHAGCRLNEALSFDVSSFGQSGLHIWGSKSQKWRWCFVTEQLSEALKLSPPPDYTDRTAERRLLIRANQAGLGHITPHHLRHTFASLTAEAACTGPYDIREVPYSMIQALLGHVKDSVTRIYVHFDLDVFNLLKLNFDWKTNQEALNKSPEVDHAK